MEAMGSQQLYQKLKNAFSHENRLCWSVHAADETRKAAFVQTLWEIAADFPNLSLVLVDTDPNYRSFLRAVSLAVLESQAFQGLKNCKITVDMVKRKDSVDTAQRQLRGIFTAIQRAAKKGEAPWLCLVLDHFDRCKDWGDMSWMREALGSDVYASILLVERSLVEVADHANCNSPFYNIYKEMELEGER